MVDLQAVNKKLVQRSENILSQLTGRSRDEVRDALSRRKEASSSPCCCSRAVRPTRREVFSIAAAVGCGRQRRWLIGRDRDSNGNRRVRGSVGRVQLLPWIRSVRGLPLSSFR